MITTAPQPVARTEFSQDPEEVSHLCYTNDLERAYLDARRPRAFCGYILTRPVDAEDVFEGPRGGTVPEDMETCQACLVIHAFLTRTGRV